LWHPVEIRKPGNNRSAKKTAIIFLVGSQTGPYGCNFTINLDSGRRTAPLCI
jgi:hypothetical protein